ncbi:MAG: hypothetical protein AB1351_09090 [Thermoproteota archaeon]
MTSGTVVGGAIRRTLGFDFPKISVITSALLALIFFFYVFAVAASLKPIVYFFQDRITYYILFDGFIVDKTVNHVIVSLLLSLWATLSVKNSRIRIATATIFTLLFSLAFILGYDVIFDVISLGAVPVIITIMIVGHYGRIQINNRVGLTANYVIITGTVLGSMGLILSILPVVVPPEDRPVSRNYMYEIFLLFSLFSPALMLLLLSCIPAKILMDYAKRTIVQLQSIDIQNATVKPQARMILLAAFALLSILLIMIAHSPLVNEDNGTVGVDTGFYVNWINVLDQSKTIDEFLTQAFVIQSNGERPLTLIFILATTKLIEIYTNNLSLAIEYIPVILGPALVIAVYFLTRQLTASDIASILAAFFTAISFHTLIGIYAGFYANWLALIIGYFSFVFLLRFLKQPSRMNFTIYSALMISLIFSHIYTWTVLAIVGGIFLAAMIKLRYYDRKCAFLLLLVILFTVVIDVARVALTSSSSGIERDIIIAESQAGTEQFNLRWNNLSYSIHTFLGGIFNNFIILLLAAYWLFRSDLRNASTIFLLIFLSIGILPILFGDWVIQTRILYDIPFQIPAAIGLTYLTRRQNGAAITVAACLWVVALAIRITSNLVLPS